DEWRPVMEAIGPECACYAPDLPGLGASDEPGATFDFSRAAYISFLDELTRALGIDEAVVLVVHDIGGVVGIPWAASRPDRIRGVVITNTVVFEDFRWFPLARLWGGGRAIGRAVGSAAMWQVGWFGGRLFRRAFARVSPELGAADVDRMTRS